MKQLAIRIWLLWKDYVKGKVLVQGKGTAGKNELWKVTATLYVNTDQVQHVMFESHLYTVLVYSGNSFVKGKQLHN